MKIVIDIPEDIYEEWKLDGKYRTHSYAQRLILNGTPLPEQQPCEDCISREAVIKIFGEVHPMDYNTQAYITNIQNLPSVTPSIPDVENNYNIGYNCGYTDAMIDIAEESDSE